MRAGRRSEQGDISVLVPGSQNAELGWGTVGCCTALHKELETLNRDNIHPFTRDHHFQRLHTGIISLSYALTLVCAVTVTKCTHGSHVNAHRAGCLV